MGVWAAPRAAHAAIMAALFVLALMQTTRPSAGAPLLAALLLLLFLLVWERRSLELAWLVGGCALFCVLATIFHELAPLLVVFAYVFAASGAPVIALVPSTLSFALGETQLAVAVCALLLGWLIHRWRHESNELREQADGLRQQLYRSEQTALTLLSDHRDIQRLSQLEERRNVAERLHDNLGHELTAADLSIKSVGALLRAGKIEHAISAQRKGEERLSQALQQLKGAVSGLDPGTESDISLVTELFERFVYPVELSIEGTPPGLEPHQLQLMHSAVKEALTNVSKHAVPQSVHAKIEFTDRIARLSITNDGILGRSGSRAGHGLRYLRKRLEAVRGSLSTTSAKNEFTLVVTVPKGRR